MINVEIQKLGMADLPLLQVIGRATFRETFASGNTAENMAKYLAEGFSEEKLREELSDANAAFYFARLEGEVIGYLKLNFGGSQTELKSEQAMEIERIYVLQAFHRKGVGQALYDHAMDIAREAKADYVWLGVWEENPRAIQFYSKNGFVAFDKHVFLLGDDRQTDIMMKKMFG